MNGAPALSPAALHLDFNDVSIFRVGGVSVSDAMLPVGQSDSMLGPLQVNTYVWNCTYVDNYMGKWNTLSSFNFLFLGKG